VATVKGDFHDIGKDLVIVMLEGAGFKVVDLGADLSVEKVREIKDVIAPECAIPLATPLENLEVIVQAVHES
jgi:5-methyltetrahydrofolate--homocysteine methyltransferase